MEQKKLKTGSFGDQMQPPRAAANGGFVGDIGRWQQRLGITVEDDCSGGSGVLVGGAAVESFRQPSSATVTTAKDLMEDSVLKEAFAARGRHKTSPVLAREVNEARPPAHGFRYFVSPGQFSADYQ